MDTLTVCRWWWRWGWQEYSIWWWWRTGPAELLQCIQQNERLSSRSPPHQVCGSPECVLRDPNRAGTPYWCPATSRPETCRIHTHKHAFGLESCDLNVHNRLNSVLFGRVSVMSCCISLYHEVSIVCLEALLYQALTFLIALLRHRQAMIFMRRTSMIKFYNVSCASRV